MNIVYEGKAKKILQSDIDTYVLLFKDHLTAFDGEQFAILEEKGSLNCSISSLLFQYLQDNKIKTHFIGNPSSSTMLVKKMDMFPLEVIVRNKASGSIVKKLKLEDGKQFSFPIVEYCLKDDELHDPQINEDHIKLLEICTEKQLKHIKRTALKVTKLLTELFTKGDFELWDIKYEFGISCFKEKNNKVILLGDEISPDSFRLRKKDITNPNIYLVYDKDIFRKNKNDLNLLKKRYSEIYSFLNKQINEQIVVENS